MKKILLASTILVGTAGIAAADNANFTWSGAASVGAGWSTLVGFAPEVQASFTAGMKTTTDTGLEAGASIKVTAAGVDFNDDNTDLTGTSIFGSSKTNGTSIGEAAAYLSGDFGKFEATYDANGAAATVYDVVFRYTNTWGDFTATAYYTFAPVAGLTGGDLGAKVTYAAADYSVYVGFDFDNSVGGSLGMKYLFGGSYSMNGFKVALDADYDMDGGAPADLDWKASASYTSGVYSVGAFIQDDNAADDFDFGANAAYDLGGGVKLEGEYKYDADTVGSLFTVGVTMAF